jgi:MFS transporter, SET family, sugar efflux transporter
MSAWLQLLRSLLRRPHFAGLLASTFALGLAFSFFAPYLSLWGTTRVGLTPRQFSLFMTAATLSAICVGTWLGRKSDQGVPRRRLLLAGGAAGAVGFSAYAFIIQPWILTLVATTFVALAAICFSQLFAHTREYYGGGSESTDAALVMSVVRVTFSVAWTAGPAVGAAVLTHFDFEGLFGATAALYALFAAGVWFFVPKFNAGVTTPGKPARTAPAQWWRRKGLIYCFVAFVAIFAAHALNMMNLSLYVTNTLGGSAKELGFALCVGPIAEIPLMLWFGQVAARRGSLWLIHIGVAVTAVYFVLLGAATDLWQVYPIQILSGMSFAILTNVAITFFQDLLPGEMGTATTVYSNAGHVGNLTGYFSFGVLLESWGSRGVLFTCAAICAASFLLLCAVKRTIYRR